ncbi:hypothetical protein PPERSA_11138 [Pseudocohnilembus persalinus]|uniref:Uncharacterized protein n=1 Tax=Pseudocohnilembus persalinus TaxID=266149 RepID=A0A0V0R090_PSEPJ|nr:hypothetical protein PPERSA_11138 [Pseudocohnilembus persalinus]|eukprot:KRX07589.1 hypothetical protein PPERSA_11138 [Pseudocohnilembus persalinus]
MQELGLTEKYFRNVNSEIKKLHSDYNMDPNLKRLHVDHHKKRMDTGFKKISERRQKYIVSENIKNQLNEKYDKEKYFDTMLEQEKDKEKELSNRNSQKNIMVSQYLNPNQSNNLRKKSQFSRQQMLQKDLIESSSENNNNNKNNKNYNNNKNKENNNNNDNDNSSKISYDFKVQNEFRNPIYQLDRLEERNKRQQQAKIKQAQIAISQEDRRQQLDLKDMERPVKALLNKYNYEKKQEQEKEQKRQVLERKLDQMKDEDERKALIKQKNYQEYIDYIKYKREINGKFYKQEYENQKQKKIELKNYLAENQENSKIRKYNIDIIDGINQDLLLIKDELYQYSEIIQYKGKNQRILKVQQIENNRNYDLKSLKEQDLRKRKNLYDQQQQIQLQQLQNLENNSDQQQIQQQQYKIQQQQQEIDEKNEKKSEQELIEEKFWLYVYKIKEELQVYQKKLQSQEIQQVSKTYSKKDSTDILLKQLLSIFSKSEDYYRKKNTQNQAKNQNQNQNQIYNNNISYLGSSQKYLQNDLGGLQKNGKFRSISLNNFSQFQKNAKLKSINQTQIRQQQQQNLYNQGYNMGNQNKSNINKNFAYSAGKVLTTDIDHDFENLGTQELNQLKLDIAKEKAKVLSENNYSKVLYEYIEKEKKARQKMENKIRKEVIDLQKKIEQNEVLNDKKQENEINRQKQLQEEMQKKNEKEIRRIQYQQKKKEQQDYHVQLQKEKQYLRKLEQQEAEELRLREQKIKQTQLNEKMRMVQNNIMDKSQKQQMLQKARINYTMSLHDQSKTLEKDIQQYSQTIAKSNIQGDLQSYKKLMETGTKIHNKIMNNTVDPSFLVLHNNVHAFLTTAAGDNNISGNS